MIVIFEGPDGAGKSTMIKEVQATAEAVGTPTSVWRAGPFPAGSDAWREYVFPLTSLSASQDWLVLIDRWHLGELVYGPLLRGGSRLSLEQRAWIEGYLRTFGAVMIHLTATVEELARRMANRGDDLIKAEQLPYLKAAYEQLIGDGHQPRIMCRTYDTTGQRTQPTAAAIYRLAKMDAAIAISAQTHPSNTDVPYWEKHEWPA
jgi:thymidylate kinase